MRMTNYRYLFVFSLAMIALAIVAPIGAMMAGPGGNHPAMVSLPFCFIGILAAGLGGMLRDANRRIAELEDRLRERDVA